MRTKTLFLALACIICFSAKGQNTATTAKQLTQNIATAANLSAEETNRISTAATSYIEALLQANGQYSNDGELVQAKAAIHRAFQEQLQQLLTTGQYAAWTETRNRPRTQSATNIQTMSVTAENNGECYQNPTSPISRWEAEYVPVAGERECWTIDLGVNKPIKFTYTIDLETVGAYDELRIYQIEPNGNSTSILYRFATAESGTITTTSLSGKAKVVFDCIQGNSNGTFKGFRLYFEAVDTDIVDGDMYIAGRLGIGTTEPQEALHVNGAIRGGESNGGIKLTSESGYVTIGSFNSYMAFKTDRQKFYFDKPIYNTTGVYDTPNRYNIQWQTNGTTRLTVLHNNGYTGIGTTEPQEQLHVNGYVRGDGTNGALRIRTTTGTTEIGSTNEGYSHFNTDRDGFCFNKGLTVNGGCIGSQTGTDLYLKTGGTTRMTMRFATGNVGIGTTEPQYRLDVNGTLRTDKIISNTNIGIGTSTPEYTLDVNGTIRAREILVNTDGGADFVFSKDYRLRPLQEVQQFIEEHRHLPEIQSAEDMEENGVSVNALQMQLLQKIEELTLYVIQQEKTIQELQKEVEELKK